MALWKRLVVPMALVYCSAVNAGNLGFLAGSAMGKFTPQDTQLMNEAAFDLLAKSNVGGSRTWRNDSSGAHGSLAITNAFDSQDGFKCKVLLIRNVAGGRQGQSTLPVCEIKPGDWKIHADAKPATVQAAAPDTKAK